MNKILNPAWLCLAITTIILSCAATPETRENLPAKTIHYASFSGGNPGINIPERPSKPAVPEYIMGKGLLPAKDMTSFLLETNPGAEKSYVEILALLYTEEAAIEGVNHDVAFAQMCLETGFLRFGGLVSSDMNNFCGLGSIGPGQNGESFPNPRTGVRAHVQHLKAYATDAPLKQELVDPRYRYVRQGSSPAIKGLSGTWAADRSYAEKIDGILNRLYILSFGV